MFSRHNCNNGERINGRSSSKLLLKSLQMDDECCTAMWEAMESLAHYYFLSRSSKPVPELDESRSSEHRLNSVSHFLVSQSLTF
jgi:hypothetical protein